ncbi:alpha/beta fold hydrolase [Aliigemmobacter aestuarii]|uniref:Alpha/beta fold hydrolase n=1 Tax=Aliigemmobacter aestuarii TaxID=1445661 RepID=A0A4S3MLD0_9RHOB|nr:alpha/beta fold hydrolase [Gemmobacter aestuarii]THD81544.1 alpha/beta fold hydrolase [Gemmobacter aestuarii]
MTDLLLVHGSCHGAWCWRDVIPALAAEGLTARAIDLPAHGDDPTPASDARLEGYARAILDAIDRPTIVVGHSMAGFPISLAAEMDPERVAMLVYVCAYVPVSGHSLARMRKDGPRQPLAPAIRLSEDRVTFSFDPAMIEDKFYHDCPPGTVDFAARHLCPEPVLPQETPVILTGRYGSVPRHYIRCTEDRAIPPEYQETMAAAFPPGHVTTLPTSHSPFFAAPEALAARLRRIADSLG